MGEERIMKIFKYKNYEEYISIQTDANLKKINKVWVKKNTIELIAMQYGIAKNILCHGTRNAAEQKFFKEIFENAYVIGTEISYTAKDFPMTIQHDFDEEKKEFLNKFDIIYSNSFDHSYDPIKSLGTWKNQLNKNGAIFIENMTGQASRAWDPLSLSEGDLEALMKKVGLKCTWKKSVSGMGFDGTGHVFRAERI